VTSTAGAKILASAAAGLVAGTTNLIAAGAIFGGTLTHGLQLIASGILGERAFEGGTSSAALGAGLHYFISIVVAGLYCALALRSRRWRDHWLAAGTLFGVIAYLVMNLIVVPLSNAANPNLSPAIIAKELVAHTVMFGIPIAGIITLWLRKAAP
jgi:hypothetical protein